MNINLQKVSKKNNCILISFAMILLTFCMLSINTIKVSAHDAYFLGIAFDSDSKRYVGTISFQSNSVIGANHAESDLCTEFLKFSNDSNVTVPDPGYASGEDIDYENYWKDFNKTNFSNSKELLFTFPGYHTKGIITDKLDGNGSDELLAERISNTIIPQLNSCLDFIIQETDFKDITAKQVRDIAVKLANALNVYDGGVNMASSITVNGETVSFSKLNNSKDKETIKNIPDGLTKDDYVKVTINGKSQPFVFQCWKGYAYPEGYDREDDPYARDVHQGNWYKNEGKDSAKKIGWDAIIAQAHFNIDIKGVQFSNLGEILPTSALISAVASLCDWAITGIRSFLGLYGLDELMLNKGTRGISYSMGLFPNGWVGPIYLMFTVCLMITWAVMGFAVIRIFMRRQLATINVGEKMNIMNELKNLAICCFLLGAFPLVFNMLARINLSLVNLFGSTTEFSNMIKSFYTLSQVSLGSILACFAGLALQIYFNFFYILRAITIAILYAIAPLCIYTVVLGGKHSKLFGAWMKELTSNIFVQSIHALMVAFFTSVSAVGGLKAFESIVVLYSFIPLTKFVKQNVFQASDGIGGAAGGLAGMATGGAAALAGNALGGGGSSGGSSGGSYKGNASGGSGPSGGGGGFGGGTGIAADRMAKSNNPSKAATGNKFSDDVNLTGGGKVQSGLANFSDNKNHSTKLGNAVASTARGAKSISDTAQGFSNVSNSHNSNGIMGLDKKGGFVNPNTKMQDIARADGRVRGGGLAKVGGIAKNVGSASKSIIGATAMAGMALGTASFDEAGGSRMMKTAMGYAGSGLGNSMSGIKNTISGDKATKQYLRNNGVEGIKSDGKSDFITTNVAYDLENHRMGDYDPNSGMTKTQWDQLGKFAEAQDPLSKMNKENPKEAAYYNSKLGARGQRIGLETSEDGSRKVVIRQDKSNPNYQRNGLESIHTSIPPYDPATMGGRGKEAPAPSEGNSEIPMPSGNNETPPPTPNPIPKPNGGGNGPAQPPEEENGPKVNPSVMDFKGKPITQEEIDQGSNGNWGWSKDKYGTGFNGKEQMDFQKQYQQMMEEQNQQNK